jgi:hypothetical protein
MADKYKKLASNEENKILLTMSALVIFLRENSRHFLYSLDTLSNLLQSLPSAITCEFKCDLLVVFEN